MRKVQKICNDKTDESDKKVVEAQTNYDNGNSNTDSKYLKFVSFLSIINQIILINL